jgi:hypothetical protein
MGPLLFEPPFSFYKGNAFLYTHQKSDSVFFIATLETHSL